MQEKAILYFNLIRLNVIHQPVTNNHQISEHDSFTNQLHISIYSHHLVNITVKLVD